MNQVEDDSDDWEMPASAEYIPELNELMTEIDTRRDCGQNLSRAEGAASEVYATIGFIECEGLVQFWDDNDPIHAIESFRIAGEHDIADALFASHWLRDVVARGTDDQGRYSLNLTEEALLDESEGLVLALFVGVPTRLLAYIKVRRSIRK